MVLFSERMLTIVGALVLNWISRCLRIGSGKDVS